MNTFTINHRLGDILKELRTKKQWTLRQASEKVGYSAAYISILERGSLSSNGKAIKVTPEALEKFSKVYDYPYNLLMIAAGYGEYAAVMDEVAVTSEQSFVKEETAPYYNSDEYLTSLQNSLILTTNYDTIMPETIADRLIKLRTQKGLTQQDFADQLSLFTPKKEGFFVFRFFNVDDISDIEKSEIKPDSDFIIAASNFYGVSCDWLLTGKEYKAMVIDESSIVQKQKEFINLLDSTEERIREIKESLNSNSHTKT
jgi:transcriptional regulator with XRE-family HTH domain